MRASMSTAVTCVATRTWTPSPCSEHIINGKARKAAQPLSAAFYAKGQHPWISSAPALPSRTPVIAVNNKPAVFRCQVLHGCLPRLSEGYDSLRTRRWSPCAGTPLTVGERSIMYHGVCVHDAFRLIFFCLWGRLSVLGTASACRD